MIEENVINWVDLGEAKTPLDIYGEKSKMVFFKFLKTIKQYNNLSVALNIFLQVIFFIQFSTLSLNGLNENDDDYIEYIFEYLSKVFILYNAPESSPLTYKIFVLIMFLITLIFISLLLYIFICVQKDIKPVASAVMVLSILIQIEIYYLIGPIIGLSLTSIVCKNGNKHIILNETCFSDPMHLIIFVASAISLIFHIGFSVILSVYYYDIGNMGEYGPMTRVPCNYEIYLNLSVIVLFIAHFIFKFYIEIKKWYLVIWEGVILIFALLFTVFIFKYVFFYNAQKNFTIFAGWTMSLWFCFMILLKKLLDVYDSTVFQIVGWIIILISIFSYLKIKYNKMITDFNVFEGKYLKDIEIFKNSLLTLVENKTYLSKTLLNGYINRFEEFLLSNPDLSGKYHKLKNDPYLNKKLIFENTISIYAIIYITYSYHIEKFISHSADLTISMCYFLINKLKNPTYAVYLCSELKVKTHLQLYYKYLLMEQIKEHLINKITYSSKKNSIRHVEIGSVILYNIFCTLFRIKIYDATSSQIEYFDNFKSTVTTKKSTENFLKNGEEILKIREKILGIWDQMVQLNPFNLDIENDYMLYLKTIIQDDVLAKTEEKKNYTLKNKNLCLRQNTYFTMFAEDKSSFVLVDGASDANLKLLYTTPNFPKLFMFSGKEMLNTSVNDLLPTVVQKVHKDFVDDVIKYSNLNKVFKNSQDVLVKTKNNGLINIKLFVKCVPNLSFGLNYMAYLSKMKDKNFIIILDKDFHINGFTENFGNPYNKSEGENFIINGNNFGLTQSVYGHHIGMVIPEILLLLSYDEQKNCFYFTKPDIELKGNLYPINPWTNLEHRVEYLLEKIKSNKNIKNQVNNEDVEGNNIALDYSSIVYEIKKKFPKPVSVFYKLRVKTFLRGTFKYYRIYISNDLVKMNQIKDEPNEESSQGSAEGVDDEKFPGTIMKKPTTLTNDLKKPETKKKNEIKFDIGKNNQKKKNNGFLKSKEEKKEDDENKENNEKEEGEKNNEEQKNKSFNIQMVGSEHKNKKDIDGLNIASSDEAKFNRLKKHILDNDEIFITFYMKLLNLLFGLLSIFCIVYDSIINKNNMISLNKYLKENLIFNHTKVSSGVLYLIANMHKYYIDGYINNTACFNGPCGDTYIEYLFVSLDDLYTQKNSFSDLSKDFSELVENIDNIIIYSSLENNDKVEINLEFMINLLINYGLRLKDLSANGIESNDTETIENYEIASLNLRNQSHNLFNINLTGFSGTEKTDKISKLFNPAQISLIVMVIFIVLFIAVFFYFIYYLYSYEVFFIEKLIDFTNPKFEAYLKTLEELKKRLRNESEEDDDEDKEDELGFGTAIGTKKEDDESNKNNKHNNKEDPKKEEQKKQKRLRGKEKNKLQHQQKKKKTIMINFFIRINIFFCIKIFVLAFLGITYYIFSSVIKSSTKTNYLEHESIADETESIYKESLSIYFNIAKELAQYEEIENKKKLAIKELNSENSTGYVIIYDKNCTNETCIKNSKYYTMVLPDNEDISFPKFGNLLMPIVSEAGDDTSTIEYKFNQLYNGDTCSVFFGNSEKLKNVCSNFWNGILTKGMEQAMTQMSVSITSVLDELKNINASDSNSDSLYSLFKNSSEVFQYETFVEFYFYNSFLETCSMFDVLKEEIIENIKSKFNILLILYCVVSVILFLMILVFIYSIRNDFNSFLNFIVIFPLKFMADDEFLYRHTLKLEDNLFK